MPDTACRVFTVYLPGLVVWWTRTARPARLRPENISWNKNPLTLVTSTCPLTANAYYGKDK